MSITTHTQILDTGEPSITGLRLPAHVLTRSADGIEAVEIRVRYGDLTRAREVLRAALDDVEEALR